jgi:glutamyl-tRNA reductase
MPFSILGINHKTAPLALREKVAFAEERLQAALRTLKQETGVAEVVILSTCNRTEVYWAGSASGPELTQWLERHHGNNLDLTRACTSTKPSARSNTLSTSPRDWIRWSWARRRFSVN